MTPNAQQARARALMDLYAQAEEQVLKVIAQHLGDPEDTPVWAQKKLSEIRRVRAAIGEILEKLESQAGPMRDQMILDAWRGGYDAFVEEMRALGVEIDGAGQGALNRADALLRDAASQMDAVHNRILRESDDIYRQVLADAIPMANLGVETVRQAAQRALNAFATRGITAFVDKAGRSWGMPEYAEMAARTGMMRAAISGYTQDAIDHGEDLVIVSDHADECPLCAVWERKILSLTGAKRNAPGCAGTVADATKAGLFHPNCEHSVTVYVPGLTRVEPGKSRTRKADAEGYKNRQRQRYMERTLRQWKRRQAAALTPEEERKCKAHVDMWRDRIKRFANENDLPRLRHREGGRVVLSDAARKMKPIKLG